VPAPLICLGRADWPMTWGLRISRVLLFHFRSFDIRQQRISNCQHHQTPVNTTPLRLRDPQRQPQFLPKRMGFGPRSLLIPNSVLLPLIPGVRVVVHRAPTEASSTGVISAPLPSIVSALSRTAEPRQPREPYAGLWRKPKPWKPCLVPRGGPGLSASATPTTPPSSCQRAMC
jgi:hypothetical protein